MYISMILSYSNYISLLHNIPLILDETFHFTLALVLQDYTVNLSLYIFQNFQNTNQLEEGHLPLV